MEALDISSCIPWPFARSGAACPCTLHRKGYYTRPNVGGGVALRRGGSGASLPNNKKAAGQMPGGVVNVVNMLFCVSSRNKADCYTFFTQA